MQGVIDFEQPFDSSHIDWQECQRCGGKFTTDRGINEHPKLCFLCNIPTTRIGKKIAKESTRRQDHDQK